MEVNVVEYIRNIRKAFRIFFFYGALFYLYKKYKLIRSKSLVELISLTRYYTSIPRLFIYKSVIKLYEKLIAMIPDRLTVINYIVNYINFASWGCFANHAILNYIFVYNLIISFNVVIIVAVVFLKFFYKITLILLDLLTFLKILFILYIYIFMHAYLDIYTISVKILKFTTLNTLNILNSLNNFINFINKFISYFTNYFINFFVSFYINCFYYYNKIKLLFIYIAAKCIKYIKYLIYKLN
jgi:hypothetical protein